jgi:hypothetical protein
MNARFKSIQSGSSRRAFRALLAGLILFEMAACSSQFGARQRAHELERQRTERFRMSQAQILQASASSYEQVLQAARVRGDLNQDAPALLRLQDDVTWKERQQLPAALFGQLLIGVYDLPFTDRPALTVGLERLPDAQLEQLYDLIRQARQLSELTLSSTR